ncbi:hydrogenase formation protein HypD [Candidatus Poribacteria bacterium]|nr:hydrogenase formation protein HypD [Candidatus Poribacteria bacterium]
MNVLDRFSDTELAAAVLKDISGLANRMSSRTVRLMEVCGTHTFAIMRSGIPGLLPSNIRLVSGPGCPVCVTPPGLIDLAAEISLREDTTLVTFGDMMRVPGTRRSLESAKAKGANVHVVYSPADLIPLAQNAPDKRIVFFAVGFETTTPSISWTLIRAGESGLKNLFIIPANKLIPPALDLLASDKNTNVHGFICPGHVSVIIGSAAYRPIANKYAIPCAVAGFEPLDVLLAIRMLLLQLVEERAEVEIEYSRVVTERGNERACEIIDEVFEPADSVWRGLGIMPRSGLKLRPKYQHMDALLSHHSCENPALDLIGSGNSSEAQTGTFSDDSMPSGCACGEVLKGIKIPTECAMFGTRCTPDNPIGPCIISSEGTCAAYYKYGPNPYGKP